MTARGAGGAIRQIRSLFDEGPVAGLSDGQLLGRFAAGRDEASFAALVVRHGPMVLGVCRRVVGDRHEAEDAFQAAFLVLARRAGAIRVGDSLAPWLYTVARRIAIRASSASRRASVEPDGEGRIAPDDPDEMERRELRAALDEEVGRLPSSSRAALILCALEGLTHEEAADRLGWPLGTVKGRLARARRLLRDRLTRRGFGLPMGAVAVALRPAVPAGLAEGAIAAAIDFVAGRAMAAGTVPAVALAKSALGTIVMTKLKLATAVAMAFGVGLVGGGIGLAPDGTTRPAFADGPTPAGPSGPRGEGKFGDAYLLYQPYQNQNQADPTSWARGVTVPLPVFRGPKAAATDGPTTPPTYDRPAAAGTAKGPSTAEAEAERQSVEEEIREARQEAQRLESVARAARDRLGRLEAKRRELASKPAPAGAGAPRSPGPAIEGRKQTLPEYVVEPPDVIIVEALEALPGRPITGERLVRPDGKISLGFYGDLYVAGLTTEQIKEKVVEHLREFLSDRALGLVRHNQRTNLEEPVKPSRSGAVFVDVASYNSKVYYVQGEVNAPGRMPVTGNETVLDAINYAGGLLPSAGPVRLVRPAPPGGGGEQVLPVDYEAIVRRADPRTNYQLFPYDRIIVDRAAPPPAASGGEAKDRKVEERIDALAKELEALRRELRDGH